MVEINLCTYQFFKKALGLRIPFLRLIFEKQSRFIMTHFGCQKIIEKNWASMDIKWWGRDLPPHLKFLKFQFCLDPQREAELEKKPLTREVQFELLGFSAKMAKKLAKKDIHSPVIDVAVFHIDQMFQKNYIMEKALCFEINKNF